MVYDLIDFGLLCNANEMDDDEMNEFPRMWLNIL